MSYTYETDSKSMQYRVVARLNSLSLQSMRMNDRRLKSDCEHLNCKQCEWTPNATPGGFLVQPVLNNTINRQTSNEITHLILRYILGWLRMSTFSPERRWIYTHADPIYEYFSGRTLLSINTTKWMGSRRIVIYGDGCLKLTLYMIRSKLGSLMILDDHDKARCGHTCLHYVKLSSTHSFRIPSERLPFLDNHDTHMGIELYDDSKCVMSFCSNRNGIADISNQFYIPLTDVQNKTMYALLISLLSHPFQSEALATAISSLILSYVTGPYFEPECCVTTQRESWFETDFHECTTHKEKREAKERRDAEQDRIKKEIEDARPKNDIFDGLSMQMPWHENQD